jgi:SAM-dependent methyltransferase
MSLDERRLAWDERHRGGDFEGAGPNPALADAVSALAPGRALELASGSGTNATWLAARGWQVTAVDWSPVGLDNARRQAGAAGVSVEWVEADLFSWVPPERAFDLVAIVYLHLPVEGRRPIYTGAAKAVAPGGRLVIVGHDRSNLDEGEGGPRDPDVLFTAAEIGRDLLDADPDFEVERAEIARRVEPPGRGPIDALLVARRRA